MNIEIYKKLSMYDFAMDMYQKAMHMKHDHNVEHYDVQEIIDYLQFIHNMEKGNAD